MNPVLLKPQSDIGAQLVVLGEVRGNYSARDFQPFKQSLMPEILQSFETLKSEADFVIVEGAGSAAEINLRKNDIANMGFALAANVPVVLVADIDRGGVIASLVGTWTLLPEAERALLKGFIVNKFRGDISLFDDGVTIIAEKTGLKCLGVLAHLPAARRLPDEDAMALENRERAAAAGQGIKIAVPRLAHIANFDDFDPLLAEPDVELVMVPRGQALPGDAELVILPGSKTTIADMEDFRAQGWDVDLAAHVRRGGQVLGICAGYQMLGQRIIDNDGIEGAPGETTGLGLLHIETRLGGEKTLAEAEGTASGGLGSVRGYEMHMGQSSGADTVRPFLALGDEDGGAVSEDGRVMGCYLHGLFAADEFRAAFLASLGGNASGLAYESGVEAALDELAGAMESHLDLDALAALAR
jgi:adenosylcobyric acid synthase